MNKLKETFPKILIIGHGGHGKSELVKIWEREFGLKYKGSSETANELFIFNILKRRHGYKTIEECHADRHNHRTEWAIMIEAYNADDKTKLAGKVLDNSDCYVGMRDILEFDACMTKGVFDVVIAVDATGRVKEESKDSFNIPLRLADYYIDNTSTYDKFVKNAIAMGKKIFERAC